MSRLSIKTKELIKESIVNVLSEAKRPLSTFSVAKKVNRSWELVLALLGELKMDNKISELVVSNIKAWKLIR